MTKIIGLTGGIGSGKTTIAKYLMTLGIPVYIADEEAKKILNHPKILQKIKVLFGETIFNNDVLNREQLAKIVFNDNEKLKELNNIIHPAVKAHFKTWLENHRNAPLVIKEAAILFESGSDEDCNFVISVIAPLKSRIERVMARDQCSEKEVLDRMKNQWTDEMRLAKSDFHVDNNNRNNAFQQVDDILKKIAIH